MEFVSKSEKDTFVLAEKLWGEYGKFLGSKAIVFALEGEMGAGKTQFTKGLAMAMGLKDQVISPTFVLEAEYGGGKLIHIDAWRMKDEDEMKGIGFGERVNKKQVIVVEWAEKVKGVIEKLGNKVVVVWVKFEYGENINARIVNWKIL